MKLASIDYQTPAEGDFESNKATIEITLNSLSESYYKHVLSVWVSNDGISGILGGVGLGDPTWESSNVSTGAGVIAAVAPSTIKIPFGPFFEKGIGK